MVVKVKIESGKYSFKVGLIKTLKNTLVLFGPAILAFLANIPLEYAWISGPIAYMVKNYLENK